MAVLGFVLCFCALFCVQDVLCNDEDVLALIDRMSNLENEVADLRVLLNLKLEISKITIRIELERYLKKLVGKSGADDTIPATYMGASLPWNATDQATMVNITEEQLMFQQNENAVYGEKSEVENVVNVCHVVAESLKRDLEVCKLELTRCNDSVTVMTGELTDMGQRLNALNETYGQNQSTVEVADDSDPTMAGSERTRILVVPIWTSRNYPLRQINIADGTVNNYSYPVIKEVTTVGYIHKHRKVLINVYGYFKIWSSDLDSNESKIINTGIGTNGIAFDDKRDIVVLSTYYPYADKSVSCMSIDGTNFTKIAALKNFSYRAGTIAVDSENDKIYVAMYLEVAMVTYDGRVQIVANGYEVNGLTFDPFRGIVYYNDATKLMSLSGNDTIVTEVTTLDAKPKEFEFYRDAIYFTNAVEPALIGVIDVSNGTYVGARTLKENVIDDVQYYTFCLIG